MSAVADPGFSIFPKWVHKRRQFFKCTIRVYLDIRSCCKTVPSLCISLDEPFLSKLPRLTAGIWLNNDIGLYNVTMKHSINIIIFLSPFVRDLIKKLLVHDRTRRLGSMKVSMYPSLQRNCRNRNLLIYSSYSNPLRYPLGIWLSCWWIWKLLYFFTVSLKLNLV